MPHSYHRFRLYTQFEGILGFDYRDTAIALGLYGGMALLDLATAAVVDIKTRNHKAVRSVLPAYMT